MISPTGNFGKLLDLAVIYPMIEMVGEENIYFTNDINLVYNVETNLNDYKVDLNKQNTYAKFD